MKKFLKKVLGKEKAAPSFQNRSPRVRIPTLDSSVFVDAGGGNFPLRNLSETGLALLVERGSFPDRASGVLRVGSQSAPIEIEIVRRHGKEVGGRFVGDSTALRGLLRRLFSDEIHALGMTEVDAKSQKSVERGEPHWFYAPGNYELFYVDHEEEIIRFEMEWNGNLISFAEGSLRTGTVDRQVREEVSPAQSSLVNWSAEVESSKRFKALRLLENIPGLSAKARQQMQNLLQA